ncbi:hypothetical protein ANANG_G00147450 [Anguilla anguilla]|uniref:Hexosyltransferase n=1 Tax=Anguilla anguilla TaxID=7936 RepID=A0A9D3MDZ0_ANGAN|nr:hypothetical protein ANANG_G00147450 [Anguilla anguilla]
MGRWSVPGLRRARARVRGPWLCALGWCLGWCSCTGRVPLSSTVPFCCPATCRRTPSCSAPHLPLVPHPHPPAGRQVACGPPREPGRCCGYLGRGGVRGRGGAAVCTVFLLGRAEQGVDQAAVLEESRRHGDILQWDFRESFFNVTLKELLFWRWFCPERLGAARYVLRTDDDVFVDVGGVLALLRLHRGPAHPLYLGHAFVGTYPVRLWWNKYYVPQSLYHGGPYPPYLGGGGYLVSRETVRLLLGASASVPLFPIDDVYVGMCARVANVTAQPHPAFLPFEFAPSLPPCTYAGVLVLHRLEPQHLRQYWSFYKSQGHTCSPAVTIHPSL